MTKKLAVSALVVSFALFAGCGDDDKKTGTGGTGGTVTGGSGGSTGGSGGSTGGSGGSTGGSGGATGGSGGATGGSGGSTGGAGGAKDGGAGADGSAGAGGAGDGGGADMGQAGADFCAMYVPMSGMLAGKSAADFCAEYGTVCTFGTGYMNMGDCVTKYGAAMTAGQTCRAGHLCNAKGSATMEMKTAHCGHAAATSVCM